MPGKRLPDLLTIDPEIRISAAGPKQSPPNDWQRTFLLLRCGNNDKTVLP